MKAVFKHELNTYFTGILGYIFGVFLLIFAGLYTTAYNIRGTYANFEYVLSGMTLIFVIIVPIITMRILAEEKHLKTDQLLYSLPISMTKVVCGKFFSLLVVYAIPLAIICIYPLILSSFGNVYFPTAYGAVVGFFLLGASLISIGMFISSMTESQGVAAGICFVVMLLNYFLNSIVSFIPTDAFASLISFTAVIVIIALIIYLMIKDSFISFMIGFAAEIVLILFYVFSNESFESLFPNVMGNLSLFERFYTFADGVFDITGVIYFVSVIVLFLFLSIQSMEKRRWSE